MKSPGNGVKSLGDAVEKSGLSNKLGKLTISQFLKIEYLAVAVICVESVTKPNLTRPGISTVGWCRVP